MAGKCKQIFDGEWNDVTDLSFGICCDCGLVHRENYEITKDGRIIMIVIVDKRRTAARRSAMRRKKEGVFAEKKKKKV